MTRGGLSALRPEDMYLPDRRARGEIASMNRDYAADAVRFAKEADAMKPGADDPLRGALDLVAYHLRTAARITREVAEYQTRKAEEPKP